VHETMKAPVFRGFSLLLVNFLYACNCMTGTKSGA